MADSSSLGLSPHHITSLWMKPVSRSFHLCHSGERERRLANGDRQRWERGVKEKCATQSQNLLTWWKRAVEKTVSCSQKRDIKLQIELLEKLVYFHFIDENFRFVFLFFFFLSVRQASPGWHQSTSGEA